MLTVRLASITDLLSSYPNYSGVSHWHDDIELILILSGEMKYNVNGNIFPLHKNEGIFVNSRQLHFGFSDTHTECIFLCILLHPILLCASPAYAKSFVLPVIRNYEAPFVLLSPKISWQQKILDEIRFLFKHRKDKTAPLKIPVFFPASGQCFMKTSLSGAETHIDNDLSAIRNMTDFIQKNYTVKISLEEIAAAGSVGISKCCRLFSRYFSQTPNNYLSNYRLAKSGDLLRETSLSITEIALSTGFNSASYYAESFRKWAGISPGEFRKNRSIPSVRTWNQRDGKSGISHFSPSPLVAPRWSVYGNKFCILFKLIASVEVLCRSADVVGCKIPATPQAINPALKVTMKP